MSNARQTRSAIVFALHHSCFNASFYYPLQTLPQAVPQLDSAVSMANAVFVLCPGIDLFIPSSCHPCSGQPLWSCRLPWLCRPIVRVLTV